ncbi:MAG: TlpA family protein disulfide reductase, partial [Nitrospiraceae bacterium]|nr:TlpA family protein disulfide reductase [Nitrospiraceae bacterium]
MAAIVMIVQNERQRTNADILDLPGLLERQAAALMNFTAPAFAVSDLDGQPVNLDDYTGRVVFLNFWTTDCPPCVRELPAFEQFAREQGETGAAVLTVNMGDSETLIREFLAEHGISGLRVALDTEGDVGQQYGIMARPVTYIIDAAGIVR